MVKRSCLVLVVMLSAGVIYAQEAAIPPPLPEELRRLVEAGEYRDALKGLTRVLDLKGAAAEPYNRFEMLTLRAECQLQLRQATAALDSLTTAQKEAANGGKPDDVSATLAFSYLIQKSPGQHYTPKTSNGPLAKKPIDILDRSQRTEAYKALFVDELAAAQLKIHQAEIAHTMPPILDGAKGALALRGIERAATGDVVQTQELCKALSARGQSLMKTALSDLSVRVDAITKLANTSVTNSVMQYDTVSGRSFLQQVQSRRRLDSGNVNELKGIQTTCGQIISAAGDLALSLAQDVDAYKEIAKNAEEVRSKAAALLPQTPTNTPHY